MQHHRLLLLTGSFALVALAPLAACSSSSDSPTTSPTDTGTSGTDTGTTPTDTGAGTDTGTTPTDTGTTPTDTGTTPTDTGSDAGSTCGSSPTLHPIAAGDGGVVPGPYCPGAGAGGDAGTSVACSNGQICCDTPSGSTPASSCIAAGGTCPTTTPKAGSSWECDEPQMCGTGKICCGNGTPAPRTGCTYDEVFPAKGTVCATSCTSAQYVVCEADADCPSGKKCTPLKSGAKQVGYCK